MSVKERGIIKELTFEQMPLILLEIGCFPSAEITLIKKALTGCPLYLDINGSHISIRKQDAKHILVSIV